MIALDQHPSGRHFLQIPGPSPVPDRILRAMSLPTIDHRGPEFAVLGKRVIAGMQRVFQTRHPVVIYAGSGTGSWEAALANVMSPGDTVLMFETGQFASLWHKIALRLGLKPELLSVPGIDASTGLPWAWRRAVQAELIEARLREDRSEAIRAVCVVHSETSTGVISDIAAVRRAIDAAGHPALLLVDTISGLGCADYRHDEWGVDVTVAGSQKGLMLPPGLSFNAVSDKALAAAKTSRLPKSYWSWEDMLGPNKTGFFPYTPATNLLYGLREALLMLHEEGLDNVFRRHDRHAEATRRAVRAWGLEILCLNPAEYSSALTAVMLPDGRNEADFRKIVLDNFNMSLGSGLGKVAGKVFRIGHLGDFNDLMLAGTLAGVEMGLAVAGVPHKKGGTAAAMDYLVSTKIAAGNKPAAMLSVA